MRRFFDTHFAFCVVYVLGAALFFFTPKYGSHDFSSSRAHVVQKHPGAKARGSDPEFSRQRALHDARLPEADEIFLDPEVGLRATVRIGVIDFGDLNTSHPDFAGVYIVNARMAEPEYQGFSHGQGVTGIIAAKGFNGIGVRGVMPSHVEIIYHSVKNGNEAAAALNALVDAKVHLVNISLGKTMVCPEDPGPPSGVTRKRRAPLVAKGKPCEQPISRLGVMKIALHRAVFEGNILVVMAAGNENAYVPEITEEFGRGVLVVGGMGYDGKKSYTSNYGDGVSMYAADYGILTLGNFGFHEPTNNGRSFEAGNSYSAPMVTGAAALAISYLNSHQMFISAVELRDLILQTVQLRPGLVGEALVAGSLDFLNLARATKSMVADRQR